MARSTAGLAETARKRFCEASLKLRLIVAFVRRDGLRCLGRAATRGVALRLRARVGPTSSLLLSAFPPQRPPVVPSGLGGPAGLQSQGRPPSLPARAPGAVRSVVPSPEQPGDQAGLGS